MAIHLVFVKRPTLNYIRAGSQTCESRLSKSRHPSRHARVEDTLLFKCGDGLLLAQVRRIDIFENLNAQDISTLQKMYASEVDGPCPDPEYWNLKSQSRYAVFLWLKNLRSVTISGRLLPSTQTAWINDFQPSAQVQSLLLQSSNFAQSALCPCPRDRPISDVRHSTSPLQLELF